MQPRSGWQRRGVRRMVEDRGEKKYNKGVPSLEKNFATKKI
jgi:hypothetical protein